MLTVVFNVSLNNSLDAADPATEAGHAVWNNYLSTWTMWNHVRTISSLLAAAAFAYSLAN